MTSKKCGCAAPSCGCCEGTRKITPVSTANRPGLDALIYRIGTHGAFFETMKARLGNIVVEAPGVDGQTMETFYPLQGLTTRDTNDPAIALLDGWATVGDVLTFYQERIANEGYLRTATERRSILELANLVGYKLRPGVSATVFLAYTLEDTQVDPVEIPAGSRSQSIPGPGEQPQSFETSDDLLARREWNNLQVRLGQPHAISIENALIVDDLYVEGISTNLRKGDLLLLVFGDSGEPSVVRTVVSTETQFEKNRTRILLQPLTPDFAMAVPLLINFIRQLQEILKAGAPTIANVVLESQTGLLKRVNAGVAEPPSDWGKTIPPSAFSPGISPPNLISAIQDYLERLSKGLQQKQEKTIGVTSPSAFVTDLLKAKVVQPAGSLQLGRSLKATFQDGTDGPAQMLVSIAPELKNTFYQAWANASLSSQRAELTAVYVLRLQAPLFGASVPDQPTFFFQGEDTNHPAGELKPQSQWLPWVIDDSEEDDTAFLDQAHEEILPMSYVMIQKSLATGTTREVRQVIEAQSVQRTAYGLTGKTTKLKLNAPWWSTAATGGEFPTKPSISQTLRRTLVFGQSEELTLVDAPIPEDVQVTKEDMSTGIVLDGLYGEFTSGRWVILSGERADIPNVSGVKGVELLMVSGLQQVDPIVAGDTIHTAILLATPTAYTYKRETLKIYGNVVKATHGETTNEPLGSGDGSQALQSFVLKQPPLTFVSAPTATGVESSLQVYVNNVEWHEEDTLAGLEPRDRKFTTKTDDADRTSVIFGNGREGARLPTGVLNVNAVYRKGIGKGGNVKADQVSLLQTKPLGVKEVINPLRASGGADREDRDQARENAPLAVMALDRLVSFYDYADFTRTFAGIAKATGKRLSDSQRQLIHLTIAGVDDIPIDPEGDLQRNLLIALQNLGDSSVATRIDARELVILVLAANIRLEPDYLWEPVAIAVRDALLEKFGFRKRALGQAALLCEIVGCIQAIEGVAYVDVDAFGGVPEKITDSSGVHRLQTLEELATSVQNIVTPPASGPPGPAQTVTANLASFAGAVLRPAQLAIFSPDIQDTIVLNQIK